MVVVVVVVVVVVPLVGVRSVEHLEGLKELGNILLSKRAMMRLNNSKDVVNKKRKR
jgi:mannitol/fructose-specific phosphotransferase system IIA component